MKKMLLVVPTLFVLSAANAFADDDVRVDEAQRLIEAGSIQPFESLNEKALKARSGEITGTELEREQGRYVYNVDILDAQGAEWDLELDASNGEVLQNRQDD